MWRGVPESLADVQLRDLTGVSGDRVECVDWIGGGKDQKAAHWS
jgi:hypothetical protein